MARLGDLSRQPVHSYTPKEPGAGSMPGSGFTKREGSPTTVAGLLAGGDQTSRFGRFQMRAYSPSFSLGQSAAVIGALKLGSSSLTEMYSSPSLETAFQPAPTSTPLPAVMRKSGASRETRSMG